MIEIAPFLGNHYVDLLGGTARFLAARGAREDDYAVASQSVPHDRVFVVR